MSKRHCLMTGGDLIFVGGSMKDQPESSPDPKVKEGSQIPDDHSKADDPDTDPVLDDDNENQRSPGVPASDPESGA
ncbi:MAG: hypothetical protein LBF06_15325 [Pseudomonas sp.]|jgi:hypothetical protein|nr:hypothetical protein [Pseudomonas sp.]